MKKVPCGYSKCGERRVHWAMPDKQRGTIYVEVEDDRPEDAPMYCSITCAVMDGAMSFRRDEKLNFPNE